MEKVEERNETTQAALLQMIQQMTPMAIQVPQQSSKVMTSVSTATGIPQQAVPTEITTVMIQKLNSVILAGKSPLAKKHKQHDVMDHLEDHPQLTGRPQSTDSRNPLQPPPEGGWH